MKRKAPLFGVAILFVGAVILISLGISKSFKSSVSSLFSQSETNLSSEEDQAATAMKGDAQTSPNKGSVPGQGPSVDLGYEPLLWKTAKVERAKILKWLRRLDEPKGYVVSAIPILIDPQALVAGELDNKNSIQGYVLHKKIRLPLGNGEEVVADQTRVDTHINGMVTWVGELEGVAYSDVFLTYVGGVWHGQIKWEHRTFEIAYGEGKVHLLREVDVEALPPDHPKSDQGLPVVEGADVAHDQHAQGGDEETTSEIAADVSEILLLGAYNTDAKNKAGGKSAIEAQIGTGTSQTTTAFSRGNVEASMRLVALKEYNYSQNSSMGTDLSRFRGSTDGYMDDLHSLRDSSRADMTIFVVGSSAGGACGVGYLLRSSSASAVKSAQFSVVSRTCATSYYSFAHELGHNMGNHHDPRNAGSGGYKSYSTGHFNESSRVRTTMSYQCPNVSCTRHLYYSNPSVNFSGVPSGVANTSDNSRSLRLTTPLVSKVYGPSGVPTISAQPQAQNVARGGTISLSVTATGTPTPSYQWYKDGSVLSGRTARTLSITNAQTSNSGDYYVRVYNSNGDVLSLQVRVTVYNPVQITTQPAATTVVASGQSFTLSVVASGTGAIRYQWYRNGSAISGATSPNYSVSSASSSNVGQFYVRVTGPYNGLNSRTATVSLGGPPTVTVQGPATIRVLEGATFSINPTVGGTSPFEYQWFYGTTALTGKTSKLLSITNTQANQAGAYRLRISNQYGTTYSAFSQVIVEFPPKISTQPLALSTVVEGSNVSLVVGASGLPAVSYQWRRNGTNLSGETSATLSLNNINRSQSGEYTVVVSNSRGNRTSNKAVIDVQYSPEVTTQPGGVTVNWGDQVNLSSTGIGNPAPTYQWYREGQAVLGANTSRLSFAKVEWKDRGVYLLELKNNLGTVRTQQVELKIQSIERPVDSGGKAIPISLDRTAGVYGP